MNRLRTAPLALLVTLAVGAMSGCSSSGSPSAGRSVPTSAVHPSPLPAPRSDAALAALFVAEPAAGYVQQPDRVGDTGPSDLAKATRDDGGPGARAALVKDGFVRGYQRLWQDRGGNRVVIFLYEFRSAGGAVQYLARTKARSATQAPKATAFAVPGIAGASGRRQTVGGRVTSQVLAQSGPFALQVATVSSPAVERQLAVLVTRAQFAKL